MTAYVNKYAILARGLGLSVHGLGILLRSSIMWDFMRGSLRGIAVPPDRGTALDRADWSIEIREGLLRMERGSGIWFEVALGKIPSVGVRAVLRMALEISEKEEIFEEYV
jgi:hypothetical protein